MLSYSDSFTTLTSTETKTSNHNMHTSTSWYLSSGSYHMIWRMNNIRYFDSKEVDHLFYKLPWHIIAVE